MLKIEYQYENCINIYHLHLTITTIKQKLYLFCYLELLLVAITSVYDYPSDLRNIIKYKRLIISMNRFKSAFYVVFVKL